MCFKAGRIYVSLALAPKSSDGKDIVVRESLRAKRAHKINTPA